MAKGKDLDWDDLRYLRAALHAGSLAAAARELRVEHTTIGRRLTSLERGLGAALVVRGPEGLRPTPIGAELVPLLDDIERSVTAVRALAAVRRSHVRLAMPSGFASHFTAGIAALRAHHPDVSLEILSGARPVDLQKGEADLAMRIGPITDDRLVARKVGEAQWALYAANAYLKRIGKAVDVDDLTGHEIIGFEKNMAGSPAAQWIEVHAKGATIVLRNREMVDMRDAALNGAGIAVLPCALGDAEANLVRLTREVVATRPISVVYRRDARLSPAVRAVVRMVVDVIGARSW